ncbi:MAG TPA: L,D-transpeptidase family protein [Acidobacteriaceae bacterium]
MVERNRFVRHNRQCAAGRKEVPGTIVVDTSNRHLYYVLPQGKAIRYGVTVGEDALAWSGVARIGRKEEWPTWVPTQESSTALPIFQIT